MNAGIWHPWGFRGHFSPVSINQQLLGHRSSPILKVANQLIANNPHAFEKKLWSAMSFGEPLRILTHKNDTAEAKQIVSEIVHHKFKTGAGFGDYAILYRGNHQSRLFEHSLREQDIPYFIT
ncbi:MAG: hypothetical protein JRD84_14210, partial [Deltaproteobacteria bacterium]|nr:hypothetical protein [Deltaproteobacteria bacterium]